MSKRKKIMVCVTQQKSCDRLLMRADELRHKKDEIIVIHVVKEGWKYFGQLKEADALDYLFETSKNYGAILNVKKAKDIEETLKDFAEDNLVDVIIMGESLEVSQQQNMINRLQKKTSKNIVFDIVPID